MTPAAATRTLPRDTPFYTGREDDLERLTRGVTSNASPRRVSGVHAIDGMPGVGKTAFAVHAAHMLAAWFPDGQIFLPLHAHTPDQQPVDPSEALATLLLSAGIPAEQIPAGVEGRSALWRHHLADKRLLLLVDDAARTEQVLPLLPGDGGCVVLVTSRQRLTALDATVSISLDSLTPDEAAQLFVRIAGRGDLGATDRGVSTVTRLCGHLPLAIRLTAGQLSHHPAWAIGDLITALAERDRPAFIRGESMTVAAAFELSYSELAPPLQKLFGRLGLQFGTEIDVYAAAALNESNLHTTRELLNGLYERHVIDEPAFGRYRFHDLMREYARTASSFEDEVERDHAVRRLLDYYLSIGLTAGWELAWNTPDNRPTVGQAPDNAPDLATRDQKVAWLEAERSNLYAATDYSVRNELYSYAVGIPFAMHGFLRTNGYWSQALSLHQAALITARHVNDQAGQANALCQLGAIERLTGDYRAAINSQAQAIELYRELGERIGEGDALTELGTLECLIGNYHASMETLNGALELYYQLGQTRGEADVLCQLGAVRRLTGDYQEAVANLVKALELYEEVDDDLGQADSLQNLGTVQQLTGEYRSATVSLARALEIYPDPR